MFRIAYFCTFGYLTIVSSLSIAEQQSDRAKRILFFPLHEGNSPYYNFLRMAEELEARGHKASILATKFIKRQQSAVKHVDYELNCTEVDFHKKLVQQIIATNSPPKFIASLGVIFDTQARCCESVLQSDAAVKELINADLVILLGVGACSLFIAEKFKKPYIILYPTAFSIVAAFAQVPSPPSYVPLINASGKMTFFQRTLNFLAATANSIIADKPINYYFKEFREKHNIKKTFGEIVGEAELHIVSSDFAVEFAHPLMPNVFYTGPILPKPAKKLPAKLEKIVQQSGEDGVLLISFGSEIDVLNDEIIAPIAKAASKLKQTVIWKVKLPEHIKVASNVKTFDWIPQNDILGHEKTKAFVSHIGANGAFEASYHGVPLIAACVWGDNFMNAQRYIHKAKMAKFIDVFNANASEWLSTMEEVVNNPSYKMNAMRVSKLMRSHPRTPVQQAGDLIEYTLANGGRLPHLKSQAFNLRWYQYLCLDVMAFLAGVFMLVTFIAIKLVKFIYRKFKGVTTEDKVKKH